MSTTVTTKDGIVLPNLPAGFAYDTASMSYTFNQNFQSGGSFRLDNAGVKNQVIVGGYLIVANATNDEDISMKLSGGHHSSTNPKLGRCYDIGVGFANNRVRLRKENPHPDYHSCTANTSIQYGDVRNKWFGVMGVKLNQADGSVLIRAYIDPNESGNWQQVLDLKDTGQWYDAPYLTTYDPNDGQTTIRVDGQSTSTFKYKKLFVCKIKPL